MDPNNKIALVTGGSRGLGKSMALALAEKGNDVIITYQSQLASALEVKTAIEAMGQKSAVLQFDATQFQGLDQFWDNFLTLLSNEWKQQSFDILINNAGMGATIPFSQVKETDFDRFLNAHFKSVFFLCQRALPILREKGRIVNVSTGTTRFAVPGYSVYASMKGAIETLTRYLAKEAGNRAITVNVLAPGPIETDFNNAAIRNHPERKAAMAAQTALGRVGQPEDIGSIVAFLCSPEAGWITGQRIEASGGINL
jgi:NAD(P)-dependent dehydrogenase (short-subunit alcohol dehydrogenase family)